MKKLLFSIFIFLISVPTSWGITVSGTVVDDMNDPIPYASVVIAGTTTGTTTNDSGKFTLDAPDNAQIQISFLGFKTKSFSATAVPSVIKMEETTTELSSIDVLSCNGPGVVEASCTNCKDPDYCSRSKCSGKCVVSKCLEECYKKSGDRCVPDKTTISGGKWEYTKAIINDNDEITTPAKCELKCLNGYHSLDGKTCTDDCTAQAKDLYPTYRDQIKKATLSQISPYKCMIRDCKNGTASDDGTKCIPTGNCKPDTNTYPHATDGKYIDGVCYPTKCDTKAGFALSGDGKNVKCDWDNCTIKNISPNAKPKYQEGKICKSDIQECESARYKFIDGGTTKSDSCEDRKGKPCSAFGQNNDASSRIDHEESVYVWDGAKLTCPFKCARGFTENENLKKCVETKPCDVDKTKHPHATKGIRTANDICVPSECSLGFAVTGTGDAAACTPKPCTIKHLSGTAHELVVNVSGKEKAVCRADNQTCESDKYKFVSGNDTNADDKCVSLDGEPCTKFGVDHEKSTYKWNKKTNQLECTFDCDKGYIPNEEDNNAPKCEEKGRDCRESRDTEIWPKNATKASYVEKSKTCYATECLDGYNLEKGKCVESGCDKGSLPAHAKSGHMAINENGDLVCFVDKCEKPCEISASKQACECPQLSKEDAAARMKELKDNQQKMHEKETSLENKMLGAAGMGTVGIGGMMALSALSEKNADEDAERDMKAYLATFRCDYGQGRNIMGGEKNVQTPTSPELMQQVAEYKQIAAALKVSKDSLDMLPGIESEVVLDSATTGLYDDVGTGIQSGAFVSLSRAMLNPTGDDAAAWQAQKDATASKLKTGATMAAVGALASMAGNIAINGKNKNLSDSILNKYEGKKQIIHIQFDPIPCSDLGDSSVSSSGYMPNCTCTDANAYFAPKEGKCIPCPADQQVNANKNGCVCKDKWAFVNDNDQCECVGTHEMKNGKCVLKLNIPVVPEKPKCDASQHLILVGDQCVCEDKYTKDDGVCKRNCQGWGAGVESDANRIFPMCQCVDSENQTFDPDTKTCVDREVAPTPENCNTHYGVNYLTTNDGTDYTNGCTCTIAGTTFVATNTSDYCPCTNGKQKVNGQCPPDDDPEPKIEKIYCEEYFKTNIALLGEVTITDGTPDFSDCECPTFNPQADFKVQDGNTFICDCSRHLYYHSSDVGTCEPDQHQNPNPDPDLVLETKTDTLFKSGQFKIDETKCAELVQKIQTNPEFTAYKEKAKSSNVKTICITVDGHTDTAYFKNTAYTEKAQRQRNQKLSEDRAAAVYNCIHQKESELFSGFEVSYKQPTPYTGHNWEMCEVQTLNKSTESCRRVDIGLYNTQCK